MSETKILTIPFYILTLSHNLPQCIFEIVFNKKVNFLPFYVKNAI